MVGTNSFFSFVKLGFAFMVGWICSHIFTIIITLISILTLIKSKSFHKVQVKIP